ncbi:MAG: carboxypeptidase-like regulatory domain-containing protein, partial [Bacteroidaceae bacterium]|nr:carboxypeptidase-like regulatory domain-containing protein [Bacteroidaceae bacterium]
MKQTNINFMQGVLRASVGLLMLSGTCVLSAQQAPAKSKAKAEAQKYEMKEVSGTVYDATTKEPMAGVRVQALNNRLYTAMTDDKGNYTIKVPTFVTALYVSVDEYNATQFAIKGDSNQNAYLYSGLVKNLYTDGTNLNLKHEYTLKETSALTVEDDIEDYLNGAVRSIARGGLPAQGAAMFINGLNSLNSNAQPLIVVDGVIWDMQYDRTTLHDGFYNNVFSVIDPEDIADVRVLTNGTSIYGAKGGNGVIEIDTRRGKSMATRIKVRAYGGFEQTPDQLKMMNAGQYRNYVTEFLGTTENAKRLSTATSGFMNEDPSYLFYDMYHNETDWQKDLYEDSYTQNYKVSVEGGDDVAMYNLSLGYTQSDATAKKNDFNRLNIRFNTDIEMFRDFTTAFDIAYTKNAYNLRDNGWGEDYSSRNISSPNVLGLIQNPFVSPYEYFVKYDNDLNKLVLGHASNVYAGKNYNDSNNPLAFASAYGFEGLANPYWILMNGDGDNKNYHEQTQFSINVAPKYRINKYWTVSDRFSYILNRNNEKYYLPNTGTPTKEVEGLGGVTSVIRTQFGKETTLFNDLRAQWKRQYGAHSFDFLGGFRMSSYSYSDSYISGYNNDNDKMPNMSYSLQYKDYGGTNDSWINLAYYADLNYNLKNKYFLRLGTTLESSSRFGRETVEGVKLAGVNWGLFPSVQAAWVVSSEPWFNVPAINYLKVNAGYEESGNDNVDYYASRTYFQNIKFLDKATSLVLANIQNPTIQWETNRRFNLGAQVNLLNNRLSLGAEYYLSTTSNLLTRKAVSDITGMSMMWGNDGELSNKGFNL